MTPTLEVIAREWAERADELAAWSFQRLVNRTDIWGSYLPTTKRHKQTFFIAPYKDARGKEFLTRAHLARHFAGLDGHLMSLHSTSADRTSRWIAIDIDRHDGDEVSTREGNFSAALAWHDLLASRGFDPLLMDTNGAGGFHVLVVLSEPVPTAELIAWMHTVIADWASRGLPREPETYPGSIPTEEGHHGDCLRLPGRHHTREHFTKVWSGDAEEPWLEGRAAVDRILETRLAAPSLLPRDLPPPDETKITKKIAAKKQKRRPRVCVDLDGVLAEYHGWQGLDFTGAPLPGAAEFTRKLGELADVVVFTTRCCVESHREELAEPTRPASDLAPRLQQKIRYWLEKYGFTFSDVYVGQGKPPAVAYVDDRAVACDPQRDARAYAAALRRVKALMKQDRPAEDARLSALVDAWSDLPEETRAAIAALVRRPS